MTEKTAAPPPGFLGPAPDAPAPPPTPAELPDFLRPGFKPPSPTAMPSFRDSLAPDRTGPWTGGAGTRPPGVAAPPSQPRTGLMGALSTPLGTDPRTPDQIARGVPDVRNSLADFSAYAPFVPAAAPGLVGRGLSTAAPATKLAPAAAATAATATGFGVPYFAGRGLYTGYTAARAGNYGQAAGNLARGAAGAAASSAVPAALDTVVQNARNPGQPQDATSRLVAPQQGGVVASGMGTLSAANASLARATGFDPLAALSGRPTTPDTPGLGDLVGRNLSNIGRAAGLAADAPAAAFRSATNALGDYTANVFRGDYFPGTARTVNENLGRAWEGLPGAPEPSINNYQNMEAFGPQALGGLAMTGSGAAGRKLVDDRNFAAAQEMLGSNRPNNPTGAADDLVFQEAMNRIKAERPELGAWADQRSRIRDTMQALPVRGSAATTNLPSGRDYEDARAAFNRPGAPPFAGVSAADRAAKFEKMVGAMKNRLAEAAPAPTIQQSYAQFRPALDKAVTAGMGGAAFAGAAPVMNQLLAAGEQAGLPPQDLMGAISTTAKNVGEVATDPAKLTQMASAPPPPELAKAIADPTMVGKLPAVGQMNEINRAVSAGEISPEEGVQSVWGQMGSGARILLGAGLGVTALSLLMNLFGGGDDEKDPEGRGGMSFFWKVAPLLGLGAAAWGLASRDNIMQPQFSRLLQGDTWSGLANDVGLGGLLKR